VPGGGDAAPRRGAGAADIHDEVVGVLRSAGYQSAAQVAAEDPAVLWSAASTKRPCRPCSSPRGLVEASQTEVNQVKADAGRGAAGARGSGPETDTQSHS